MINSVAETISFVSQVTALEAGDVIFTGTSGRPRALSPGDVVEVEASGIGVLSNPVIADPVESTWKDLREDLRPAATPA
jgi:2-keto-4-pentenoate hydratase/2-oxohepta-3-ene-1,7-dioic acid hydratase in catechol pathway